MKQIHPSPLLIVGLVAIMVFAVACDRPEPQVVLETPQPGTPLAGTPQAGTPQQPEAVGSATPTLPPVEATANLGVSTPGAQETPQAVPTAQETPGGAAPGAVATPGPQELATAQPQVQPTAAPPPAQPTAGAPGVYTVKPGDTLYSVAQQTGVNPYSIAAANHIPYPYILYPGQQLVIPAPGSTVPPAAPPAAPPAPVPPHTGCRYYYVVRPGDNLYRISLAFGVPMPTIAAANGIYNYNLIYAGQTLCIP